MLSCLEYLCCARRVGFCGFGRGIFSWIELCTTISRSACVNKLDKVVYCFLQSMMHSSFKVFDLLLGTMRGSGILAHVGDHLSILSPLLSLPSPYRPSIQFGGELITTH